ncbi:hypothetical protein DRW07_14185 [Alteromonas sediminis]|uniref:Solute-binding protein family 3/N-terminal domain-containing protein n=1 Tax=Alteromonas sediminis TaxID=2259342 RepID=A0A3N5XZJ1_9ALTE|nr:hypothetical protein [Alteromonas sediminis]RPJ65953.1 hypothetical protein DRW07_14185 [Alteromonas sediminis]
MSLYSQYSKAQDAPANIVKPEITIGVVVFPPFTLAHTDKPGCYGPFINQAVDVFLSSGMALSVVCAPAARIYRLLQSGEIDMTINVHSTAGIVGHVKFFNRPFSFLELSLVSYADATEKSVAAIRAFDYGGYRGKLSAQGYKFINVPTALDAINVFLRRRSESLITYKGPFDYMMATKAEPEGEPIVMERIAKVPVYFAVANNSPNADAVNAWLASYSLKLPVNKTFMAEPYMPAKIE